MRRPTLRTTATARSDRSKPCCQKSRGPSRLDAAGSVFVLATLAAMLAGAFAIAAPAGAGKHDVNSSDDSSQPLKLSKKFKGKLPITELTEDRGHAPRAEPARLRAAAGRRGARRADGPREMDRPAARSRFHRRFGARPASRKISDAGDVVAATARGVSAAESSCEAGRRDQGRVQPGDAGKATRCHVAMSRKPATTTSTRRRKRSRKFRGRSGSSPSFRWRRSIAQFTASGSSKR